MTLPILIHAEKICTDDILVIAGQPYIVFSTSIESGVVRIWLRETEGVKPVEIYLGMERLSIVQVHHKQ